MMMMMMVVGEEEEHVGSESEVVEPGELRELRSSEGSEGLHY